MRLACERAGIDRLNFHALRHTWASLATMNGTPLAVVAAQLGHGSVAVTEKNYAHLAPTYIAAAIRSGAPRYGLAVLPGRQRAS